MLNHPVVFRAGSFSGANASMGLFELRFDLVRTAWRITYDFAANRRIVLLTVFRKQRQNERHEVQRARQAMERCIREGHTAEEN
jgi:phage-related protein